jgi:hypothetical protein
MNFVTYTTERGSFYLVCATITQHLQEGVEEVRKQYQQYNRTPFQDRMQEFSITK